LISECALVAKCRNPEIDMTLNRIKLSDEPVMHAERPEVLGGGAAEIRSGGVVASEGVSFDVDEAELVVEVDGVGVRVILVCEDGAAALQWLNASPDLALSVVDEAGGAAAAEFVLRIAGDVPGWRILRCEPGVTYRAILEQRVSGLALPLLASGAFSIGVSSLRGEEPSGPVLFYSGTDRRGLAGGESGGSEHGGVMYREAVWRVVAPSVLPEASLPSRLRFGEAS
jgi:hypothetical protein